MKKVTGKALSLVLSLALVVSSFSATFANAATAKSESVNFTADGSMDLVTGTTGDASKEVLANTAITGYTTDHLAVANMLPSDVAMKSGKDLVNAKIDPDSKDLSITLKDTTSIGSEVLAVRYTADSYRYTDPATKITFYGEKDFTINVYKKGQYVVDISESIAKNDLSNGQFTGHVYKAALKAGTNSQADLAANEQTVYTAQKKNADGSFAGDAYLDKLKDVASTGDIFVKAVSSNKVTMDNEDATTTTTGAQGFKATLGVNSATSTMLNAGPVVFYVAPITITTAKDGTKTAALDNTNSVVVTKNVNNAVELNGEDHIKAWHGSTWAYTSTDSFADEKDSGISLNVGGKDYDNIKRPATSAINVTNSDVVLGTKAVTMESGTVLAVTGAQSFTLTCGTSATSTVSSVKLTGATSDFTLTNGRVSGDVKVADAATINGGTAGTVTAAKVTIDTADAKVPTSVSKVVSADVTVKSTNTSVNVGSITLDGTDGVVVSYAATGTKISIDGENVTVGAIDLDHRSGQLQFGDFKGSVVAPANAENATIYTTSDKADVTMTGAINVDTVNVGFGTFTVGTGLNVKNVTGCGTLVIPANGMYVLNSMNSVYLKLNTANVSQGMTVFTAAPYKVYEGSFNPVGFSIEKVSGSSSDSFKVKDTVFAGITLNKNSSKIVKGAKETFTVSAYPAGKALPDGDKIAFTFDGSADNFKFTPTDTTATVEATNYSDLFSTLNKGTLTAKLVNATTGYDDPNFKAATCSVEITKTPTTAFKSDTTGNLNKKIGETYQFKITSADGSAPVFAVASNGATVVANGKSGNDYFFKVTPTKVGSFGVYVSGTKVAVLVVTSGVKCDTSKVTVAAGKTYQFKVTASAQPTFVVATVGTIKLASKNGNDYFYKVTATKTAGAHGVYINGVLTAVITFA